MMQNFPEKCRHERWTAEEIEILRSGFRNGKRIKLLAMEIGRTASAVNKCLSRTGIRPKTQVRRPAKKKKKDGMFELSQQKLDKVYSNQIQTAFIDVVNYLGSKGYKVDTNRSPQSMFYINEIYLLNGKPISEARLVLLANKLRIEERLPIFAVEAITW